MLTWMRQRHTRALAMRFGAYYGVITISKILKIIGLLSRT